MHLVITDSGLGGLGIAAALERALAAAASHRVTRITYVNAWPEEGRGYNEFPDVASRAAILDRVMSRLDAMRPGLVLVACNTLSILYEHTRHRARRDVPVQGIVDAGVAMFAEALRGDDAARLVLVGTRTTIESGVHRARLLARGIAPDRVHGASCHGLATAIENDPRGASTGDAIERCATQAAAALPEAAGGVRYLGLCCTHYGFVREQLRDAFARRAQGPAIVLNPNDRAVEEIAPALLTHEDGNARGGPVPVRVISKVHLDVAKRENMARLLEPASRAVADALRAYDHVPGLF